MKWFTSDPHFGHRRVCRNRYKNEDTDAMNEDMIRIWNEFVSPKDEIFILGDLSFTNKTLTAAILDRLHGQKFLVWGNHDYKIPGPIAQRFGWVKDRYELKFPWEPIARGRMLIVLDHYPIESWNKMRYGSMHLHGHCHGTLTHRMRNRIDVGWDVFHRPMSLDEILQFWEPKPEAVDWHSPDDEIGITEDEDTYGN